MSKKKNVRVGECRICGEHGRLTFEHVPNRAAYNKATVIEYSCEDMLLQRKAARKKVAQGGAGEYTLCERCNNNTGHWYGDEYSKWVRACFDFLATCQASGSVPAEAAVTLHSVYPLRFIKQVVVCFFSVAPGLRHTHPQLVRYVLEKEENRLSAGCRFFLNFYHGPNPKLRRWPIAGKITVAYGTGRLIPLSGSVLSEITHPPFALTMADEMGFDGAGEITGFTRYEYDQADNVTLKLRVIRGDSLLPGSFQ